MSALEVLAAHYLEELEPNPGGWTAVCSCTNPDGDGVGAVQFSGTTALDAAAGYGEHLEAMFTAGGIR